ncbi:MAG TPA: class I SAM-dependent methyltransferase [Candidatus Dormibacteraeota bacterium]|nr:class I SAM-dependent methyltransferase [Candidatus Dormibacteraeota bacterium]
MSREHWEKQASNWAAWARTPDFDAYWKYAPAFFEIVPPPRGVSLEVGCGEGRVTRDLARRGYRVVAVDATRELIKLARDADRTHTYLRCDAAALPFAAAAFDLVVLYNSLMDVDDMEGSVREAARVLRPGGHMCVCVTHPIADAGAFESGEPDAAFVIKDRYLGPRRWLELPVEREGLRMDFSGWAYPLEAYFTALERAGLMVEAIREPRIDDELDVKDPSEVRWRRIPTFLMWRAVKAR